MQEERFSEQESLQLIESMINRAKNHFSEDGHLYLLWGWVILICSVAQFLLQHVFHYAWHYAVWWLTWLTVIYQYVYLKRKIKRRKVKTYTEDILSVVWLAFIVTITLFAAVIGNIFLARGQNFYVFINPILLVSYGVPTFITGFVLKFKPLWIGGIGCWVLSIAASLLPADFQVLMLALAMIIAWIIPGYLLNVRNKKLISSGHGL